MNTDRYLCYRARLVVHGFEQQEGLDYQETFAPVAKFTTVRVLLALAAHFNWEVHRMDLKMGFLYPKLQESVYIAPPEGYAEFLPASPAPIPTMLRLLKSLHGLKQASYVWESEIDGFLHSFGLVRSNQDHNLYISQDLIVLLYVNNILILAASVLEVALLKEHLSGHYAMVDINKIRQYLGIQINQNRSNRQLFLHPTRYTETILSSFGMADCQGEYMPIDGTAALAPPEDPAEAVDRSGC